MARRAAGRPSATWPAAWPSPAASPPASSSGPPPAWPRSSTCRCWAWPCGSCRPDIVASGLYGGDPMPKFDRSASPNPLVGNYRTSDGRFITLMMLQSDRFWPDFCEHIGRPDLRRPTPGSSTGPPATPTARSAWPSSTRSSPRGPSRSGRRPWPPWPGVWAPGQMASELVDDVQVQANGYLSRVERADGKSYDLVANPVQMDETADQLVAGPRARPAHRGDPPRAGPRLGPDHRPQGVRRHPLTPAGPASQPADAAPVYLGGKRRAPSSRMFSPLR